MESKMLLEYYNQKLAAKKLEGIASPSFDYENFNGGKTKLEDLRGKYVYIDVWATWCGPCIAEIPSLKKVEEKYHGKNIVFVGISVDTNKDHEKWQKFVTKKELAGVQLFADKDWNSDFIKAFGINSIPRFLLIDPEGKVVKADAPGIGIISTSSLKRYTNLNPGSEILGTPASETKAKLLFFSKPLINLNFSSTACSSKRIISFEIL